MSKTPKADQAPADLAERGRELWTSVVPAFTLEPHERVVLATACRQADLVAALEDVLARDGLIVAGSAGQPRLTPVAAELRQARLALGKLLDQMRLPVDDTAATAPASFASQRAQKAANARWAGENRRRAAAGLPLYGSQAGADGEA